MMKNVEALRYIRREAMKNVRLFKRIIEWCDQVKPGDLFYWGRQGIVFKFCMFSVDQPPPSRPRQPIDGHLVVYGRVRVKLLTENGGHPAPKQPWFRQPLFRVGSYSLVHCLEWSPITVKDLPLHINAPIKYPEFDRTLKGIGGGL